MLGVPAILVRVEIRDAVSADLDTPLVAGPDGAYAPQMVAALDAMLAGRGVFLIATVDGRPAGRVAVGFDGDGGYVFGLVVDPEMRRRGVATALMDAVELRSVAAGIERLRLEVGKANPAAVALYRRRDYRFVGSSTTCGLQSGGRVIHAPEPVWIMERSFATRAGGAQVSAASAASRDKPSTMSSSPRAKENRA